MLRWCLVFACFVSLLSSSNFAFACATCSAGDPTLTASGSEKPFASRKRISLNLRATKISANDVDISEQRLELRTDFALSQTLMLTAALPSIHRSIASRNGAVSRELTLGDAELRASSIAYDTGISAVRRMVLVFGGLKFPTAPLQTDAHGAALPVALQPGCGSIAPTLGASFVASSSPITLTASTSFYLPFSVRDGPHAGDSWRTSFTLQFQPAKSKIATRFGASTRLDEAGTLGDQATIDPNSGGLVVYGSGEIIVSPATDLVFGVGFFSPAVQLLRGNQRESTIAMATASYDF
ncbi:MAG: hypothetical protein ABI183_05740 [Polyangiaceae bacterium]